MHKSKNSGQVVEDPKLLRKLGNNESYQLALYILNQYRGTSVACRYVIPPTLRGLAQRTRLVEVVQASIADNVLKHPVLQVGIANADSAQPIFVKLDSLDLRQHVKWQFLDASADFEATLQELTTSQLDATFPDLDKQPGWKIVVLYQDGTDFLEILFTWNHPHCDGMSGKIFHQTLIQFLNARGGSNEHQDLDANTLTLPATPTKLPPPIEQIMGLPLEIKYLAKALLEDNTPRMLRKSPILAHWAPITPLPYKTQFRAFTIENTVLSRVLEACGRHRTTLTGLFHGLVLVSLASRLERRVAPGFQAATTINIRRFVPLAPPGYPWLEPERTMGNFVTQLHHSFNPELVAKVRLAVSSSHEAGEVSLSNGLTSLIWDAAVKVRGEIVKKLELGLKNDVVGTLKFVKDWRAQQKKATRMPREASWMITGLGVLGGGSASETGATASKGEQTQWGVRRAQFALSAEVPAAALMISPMTAAGEKLCVGGSWQDCVLDVTLGEGVMADLERWLGKIAV